jgi:aminoglycoside 3-N-acetyltransferase
MGALSESGRLHPGAIRTGHPIYSFAVLGARAKEFEGVANESGYGPDSPFATLHQMNGKIGVLDLDDQNSMTFYHHVEEMHAVDYRYFKEFTAPYTDARGVTADRSFKLFVRDLERGVLTDVNPMGERLWASGLYRGSRPRQDGGLRTILAGDLYRATSEVIRSGTARGTLYSIAQEIGST